MKTYFEENLKNMSNMKISKNRFVRKFPSLANVANSYFSMYVYL